MKKALKFIKTLIFVLFFTVFSLINPAYTYAQTSTWEGVCVSETDPDVATIQGLQCLIANILSVILTIIGLAGFIMLIVGAFRWMLSGGNQQSVSKAGNTMVYAVIGLILALSSFMILNIIAQFTGVESILEFVIPSSDTTW